MSAVLKWWQIVVIAAFLVSGLSLPSSTAAMQAKTTLHVGGKVRYKLDTPRADWRQGELTGVDSDTLHLVDGDGGGHAVAARQIRTLQVSSGRGSNAGRGATIGGLVGAALGLVLGAAASTENCTSHCGFTPDIGPQEVVAAAAILGGLGAGIGALIGATSQRDRWVEASRPWSVAPAGP